MMKPLTNHFCLLLLYASLAISIFYISYLSKQERHLYQELAMAKTRNRVMSSEASEYGQQDFGIRDEKVQNYDFDNSLDSGGELKGIGVNESVEAVGVLEKVESEDLTENINVETDSDGFKNDDEVDGQFLKQKFDYYEKKEDNLDEEIDTEVEDEHNANEEEEESEYYADEEGDENEDDGGDDEEEEDLNEEGDDVEYGEDGYNEAEIDEDYESEEDGEVETGDDYSEDHESENDQNDENLEYSNEQTEEETEDETVEESENSINTEYYTISPDYVETNETDDTCSPATKIFFLKTHKTGSSTIQNILLRFGEDNDLNFALPRGSAAHTFPYNDKLALNMVRPSKKGNDFDILLNHLHYNEYAVDRIMPDDDVFKFSVLREPGAQLESTMDYYRTNMGSLKKLVGDVEAGLNRENADKPVSSVKMMHRFLQNPYEYYQTTLNMPSSKKFEHMIHNGQLYDFGLETDSLQTTDKMIPEDQVMQFIHKISKTFDFIAITEYFDESLILLGEILCWPLEQLAYFSINQRHDAKTKNEQSNLEALKNYGNNHWNRYDFLFYQHMNKTFWQQAEEYGIERLNSQVEKLRILNKKLAERCLHPVWADKPAKTWADVNITRYNLKSDRDDMPEVCSQAVRAEQPYLKRILNSQILDGEDIYAKKKASKAMKAGGSIGSWPGSSTGSLTESLTGSSTDFEETSLTKNERLASRIWN